MIKKLILLQFLLIALAFGQIARSELFNLFDYYEGTLGEPLSANDMMPSGKGNLRILMRNRYATIDKYWNDDIFNKDLMAADTVTVNYFRMVHLTAIDYGVTDWLDIGFRLPFMLQAADYIDEDPKYHGDLGDFHLRLRAEPLSDFDYFWRSSIAAGLKAPTAEDESNFINTSNGTFDITFFWYNMFDFGNSRIMVDVGYVLTGQHKTDSSSVLVDVHNGDLSMAHLIYDFNVYDEITGGVIVSGIYMDRTKVFYQVGGPHHRNDDSYTSTISPYLNAHIPNTPVSVSLGSFHTIQARNLPILNGFQMGIQVDGMIWF